MFSGIIEETGTVLSWIARGDVYELIVTLPATFSDLGLGDSIAVNGVCLTLEEQTPISMRFSVGPETLNLLDWRNLMKPGLVCNLERSLRMGDRVHGHFVSGHVEGLGIITAVTDLTGARMLEISIPVSLSALIWKKGSVAINGTSLTINGLNDENEKCLISVCLIPETLKRTNLGLLQAGNKVNIEPDFLARGLLRFKELGIEYNN